MNLLAFDTSSSILNVALAVKDNSIFSQSENGMRHSEMIMELTDSLFKKAEINPRDLNGVLCMGGPGSFTGLRIGFSIAKGLALSLSIPFAAVPTLDCLSFPHQERSLTLAVLESSKKAWYFAFYRMGKIIKPPQEGSNFEINKKIAEFNNEKIILTGPASDLLYQTLQNKEKETIFLSCEKRGYANELISIAKKTNLFDNENKEVFLLGPEYYKTTVTEAGN